MIIWEIGLGDRAVEGLECSVVWCGGTEVGGKGVVALLSCCRPQWLRQGSLTWDGPEAAVVRPVQPRDGDGGLCPGPLGFPVWLREAVCAAGTVSSGHHRGLCPGERVLSRHGAPGPAVRISVTRSLARSLAPRTGQLTCDLGVEGSQAVSVWSGWTRRGQGPGRGQGWRVRVPRDYIHSRCILVILVPVCPRGQICPLPGSGHTKQLFVPRDLCPLP